MLLDLLAGKITQQEFFEIYHFTPERNNSSDSWNPFNRKLQDGRLIAEVILDKATSDRDDNWIIFKFGSPDAAISQYMVPIVPSENLGKQKTRKSRNK